MVCKLYLFLVLMCNLQLLLSIVRFLFILTLQLVHQIFIFTVRWLLFMMRLFLFLSFLYYYYFLDFGNYKRLLLLFLNLIYDLFWFLLNYGLLSDLFFRWLLNLIFFLLFLVYNHMIRYQNAFRLLYLICYSYLSFYLLFFSTVVLWFFLICLNH
jgi:hypothetical protein